jgi:hypothetical protein
MQKLDGEVLANQLDFAGREVRCAVRAEGASAQHTSQMDWKRPTSVLDGEQAPIVYKCLRDARQRPIEIPGKHEDARREDHVKSSRQIVRLPAPHLETRPLGDAGSTGSLLRS